MSAPSTSTGEFVDSQAVREYLLSLQQRIVGTFEQLDGEPFRADAWEKPLGAPLGGVGLTRILEDGALLEPLGEADDRGIVGNGRAGVGEHRAEAV